MASKVYVRAYLDGNTGKGKKVKFQKANQYLVELIHCFIIDSQEDIRNDVENTDSSKQGLLLQSGRQPS